jgi:DNA-binding response OmpR family regulator
MAQKRLLLIEDDFDVAEMLLMYFAAHQYEVIHAHSGSIGADMARTRFPSLILLDVMLPDMDGYEVCHRIRQTSLTKYIPIIFLTQRDERANRVRGLELGADDYITKPFDIDELRLRVQGSIKRATRESLHEPRTGLPTGPLVAEELARRKVEPGDAGLRFTVSGFKPYGDLYGFVAANEVMAFAARAIQEVIAAQGTPDDFVGIDGNEFVVHSHAADIAALQKAIQDKFDEGVKAFYSYRDVEQGGIVLKAGTESESIQPLMRLTIA